MSLLLFWFTRISAKTKFSLGQLVTQICEQKRIIVCSTKGNEMTLTVKRFCVFM